MTDLDDYIGRHTLQITCPRTWWQWLLRRPPESVDLVLSEVSESGWGTWTPTTPIRMKRGKLYRISARIEQADE